MSEQRTSDSQRDGVVDFPASGEPAQTRRVYRPGSPSRTVLIGVAIILTAFVGLGTWAALAPLDSAAMAPGTVIVESQRKSVQHPEGGVVREIAVAEGDRVRAGDLLVKIDPTEPQANFTATRQKLNAALAKQARLEAEQANADTIDFPDTLLDQAGGSGEVRQVIVAAMDQFEERRESLDGRIAVQREKIKQLQQKITGLQAQRTAKRNQVDIMQEELKGLRELYEKGYYPRTRILRMERQLEQLNGDIGATTASIAQARNSISEARLQIQQVRQRFREEVAAELAKVNTRVSDLRQQLVIAEQRLSQTDLRAPQDGVVQNVKVHTVGGVIRPAQEIMQVIPVQDRLVVRAKVQPRDIDIVAAGQRAEVRMTALQGASAPTLMGEVTRISPDRITEQTEGGQTQTYYSASVQIPRQQLAKLGDEKLQAGMPAQVLINTGEQTVLEYLMRPITDAMSRGFIEK